jgi:hypothetical protein
MARRSSPPSASEHVGGAFVGGQKRLEVQFGERHVGGRPPSPVREMAVDVDGDRAAIGWRITGAENHRGVNLMRVRDGQIVEALGYGKRP